MNMQMLGDFHIHTHFCPHGSPDQMEQYVEKAIEQGLSAISFTEHAPLPKNFQDPAPAGDSAMRLEDLAAYLTEGKRLKEKYQDKLSIRIGFEVDYIEGYHQEIRHFLDQQQTEIDDAILSVHMLKAPDGSYVCLDYSAEEFERIIHLFGSVDAVYQSYYRTLSLAIKSDLGRAKPNRIGHLNLIEKFSKKFPATQSFASKIDSILALIKQHAYTLDLNTAGLYKPDYQQLYPNTAILQKAMALGIDLVPGSDSHTADAVARGFDKIADYLIKG